MHRIREKELEIIKKVVYVAIPPLLLLLLSGYWPQFKGLLFGLLMTLLAFHHIFVTGRQVFSGSKDKVRGRVLRFYLIRYIIYGATIAAAFLKDDLDLVSVVIGLLMVKLVLVGDSFFRAVKRYLVKRIHNYHILGEAGDPEQEH
ncbi:MAG: ATP synthase subunit I [Halanaerobium sp.]|nr:ATP synthase subunit I [Halanaerobium sp.]